MKKKKTETLYTCECGRTINPAKILGQMRAKKLGKKKVREIAKRASTIAHR